MKEKFGKHSVLHLSLSLLVLGTVAIFLQLIETIFHYEIKLIFSKTFNWVLGKIKMLFTSVSWFLLGKTKPSVLSTSLGVWLLVVSKT